MRFPPPSPLPRRRAAVALLIAALAGGCRSEAPPPGSLSAPPLEVATWVDGEELTAAYRDGAAGFAAGDFARAAAAFERAVAANPGDEVGLYLAAAAHAGAGNVERTVRWLEELAIRGSDLVPQPRGFAQLAGDPGFERAAAAVAAAARRPRASEVAFRVPDRTLFPEGIAWDPVSSDFFLGSLYRARIVRVETGAGGGAVSDLVPAGRDGLFQVLGLAVDAERRRLWAASAAQPPWAGLDEENRGRTAVFAFDVDSGALLARHPLPASGLFNDLDVAADGTVYVTESVGGAVYRIPPGGELELLRPAGSFPAAGGVAVGAGGTMLYIANWESGLSYVNLAGGAMGRLRHRPGVSFHGADGIAFDDGALWAVFNAVGPGRVARFRLDESGTAVLDQEILAAGHPLFDLPTTGVVADDGFYYIANSQFASFDEEGRPFAAELLAEPAVLRIGR